MPPGNDRVIPVISYWGRYVKSEFLSRASRLALAMSATSLGFSCPALAASFSTPPNSTTAQTVSNNDTGSVAAGSSLSVTGTAISWVTGLASPGVVITNNGTISATSRGIDTSSGAISGNLTLINNAGAVFTAANDAFRINGGLSSGTVTVDNFGTIQATSHGRVFEFLNQTSKTTGFSISLLNTTDAADD